MGLRGRRLRSGELVFAIRVLAPADDECPLRGVKAVSDGSSPEHEMERTARARSARLSARVNFLGGPETRDWVRALRQRKIRRVDSTRSCRLSRCDSLPGSTLTTGLLCMHPRLFLPAEALEDGSKFAMQARSRGVEPQRFAQLKQRVVELPSVEQHLSVSVVHAGRLRVQDRRPLEKRSGLGRRPLNASATPQCNSAPA